MGGKGSSPPQSQAPPPQEPQMDMAAMMIPMMEMMMTMSQSQTPQYSPPPQTDAVSNVNWADKQKEIQDRIAADSTAELKRKKGRASTVLTDPLEETEVKTVQAKAAGA